MRYIKKLDTPQFFTDDTTDLNRWNEYFADKKRVLKNHILENEQNYLCCYCEEKIDIDNSHIEHIKPKNLDIKNLTFNYSNLAISCNGTCNNEAGDNTRYNCGHKKDNEYDEEKFLNPVEIKDIREYFKYDFDNFKINPSAKQQIKSKYMIDTLKLNDDRLLKAREKALRIFIKKFKIIRENKKKKMIQILNKENLAFISFLRYRYKHIL